VGKKKSLTSAFQSFDKKEENKKAAETAKPDEGQKPSLPPSRKGKKAITGFFDPAVSKQMKQIGLEQDRTLQDLMAEAINDLFQKHGKPPIA